MNKIFFNSLLIFLSGICFAQSNSNYIPIDPTTIFGFCGTNGASVFKSNQEMANAINADTTLFFQATNILTTQPNFPVSQIVTCGNHFRIYYEDINIFYNNGLNNGPQGGFHDPSSTLSAQRQNTLCAVLQQVENTLNIPPGVKIDLYIDQSYSPIINQAPNTIGFLAQAGPYYASNSGYGITPGYYGGNVFEHIITGNDPEILNYDAHIQVNFDIAYANNAQYPCNYWDDYSNTSTSCKYDLFTVLLHEVTHTLGFLSDVEEDGTSNNFAQCSVPNNGFTLLDKYFFWFGDITNTSSFTNNQIVNSNSNNPIINSNIQIISNALRLNKIWTTSNPIPNNDPVYSGIFDPYYPLASGSLMSHLNDNAFSFTGMSQYSPGFQPHYVMAPTIAKTQLKRQWTLQELRMLLTIGYLLEPVFAASNSLDASATLPLSNFSLLTNNHPPYRTNNTLPITVAPIFQNQPLFPESQVDFSIVNNISSSLIIDVSTDITHNDLDAGDNISIMPGSLFGIRGVSSNGNNHGLLSVNTTMTQITFTPSPGYIGKAQFGFYLYDGHEQGSMEIYTIDVLPGNFVATTGNNLIVNGDFEDGTEQRQWPLNTNFSYTTLEYGIDEGYFSGENLSGGHPHNFISNFWNAAGGDIVKNQWANCLNMPFNGPQQNYGSHVQQWNAQYYNNFNVYTPPIPTTTTSPNERYHNFDGTQNFSVLMNPALPCSTYTFEFDINFQETGLIIGQTLQMNLLFISDPTSNPLSYTTYFTVPITVTVNTITQDSWQHVSTSFNLCASQSVQWINLTTGSIPIFYKPIIDNLNLHQINPAPVTIVAAASPSTICAGNPTILSATSQNAVCTTTYNWMPGNISGNPINVTPTTTTIYTVTVTDCANQTASTTITVTVLPLPIVSASAAPVTFCTGDQVTLTANGAFTYNWNPGNINGNPIVINPTVTTTYTVTGTAINGCTSTATVQVTLDPGCCQGVFVPQLITSSNNTVLTNASTLSIIQDVTINGTSAVLNCPEVLIKAGKKIILTNNATLTITNSSWLHACADMWDGIYVNPGCTLIVNNNSLIEDALNAVVSVGGGVYTISGAIFNKNYKAVVVQAFSGNHPGIMNHTVITCRDLGATFAGHPSVNTLRGVVLINAPVANYPVANNAIYPLATLRAPHLNQRSYTGFEITSVGVSTVNANYQLTGVTDIVIGTGIPFSINSAAQQLAVLNIFDNIDFGARATDANVTFYNNAFENISGPTRPLQLNQPTWGIAIWGTSSNSVGNSFNRMQIGTNAPLYSGSSFNTFFECNIGVDLDNYYELEAFKNRMRSLHVFHPIATVNTDPTGNYGYFITATRFDPINIINGDIVNVRFGIYFLNGLLNVIGNQQQSGQVRFNLNTFENSLTPNNPGTDYMQQAIYASNLAPNCGFPTCHPVGNVRANNNTITKVFNGIALIGWREPPYAEVNSITMVVDPTNGNHAQAGIMVRSCLTGSYVFGNNITGPTTTKLNLRGIYSFKTLDGLVQCNTVTNTGESIVFEGNCYGADFEGNTMTTAQYGLVLLNDGIIGTQGTPLHPSDNFWTVGTFTAQTLTVPTIANFGNGLVTQSKLRVRAGAGYTPTSNVTTGASGADNYIFGTSLLPAIGTFFNCSGPPPALAANNSLTHQDLRRMVTGTAPFAGSTQEVHWLFRQYVFRTLRADPSLMVGDTLLQHFFANNQSTSLGMVEQANVSFDNADIPQAVSYANSYSALNLPEQNHQQFDIVLADWLLNGNVSSSERTTLWSIANQCGLTGGEAVDQARCLLQIADRQAYSWNDSCVFAPSSRISANANDETINALVIPNPNNGTFTVMDPCGEDVEVHFEVYTPTGEKVYAQSFAKPTEVVDLSWLSNGVYIYRFESSGCLTQTGRIVIIH